MISDEIKEKLKKIDSGGIADTLLSVYKNNPSIRGDIDVLIAVKSDDTKEAVSMIKKEISSIKKSSRFIDYYAARDFSHKLDNMRDSILNLSTKHPKEAFGLMKSFMESHESVLNRCDDSDGVVSGTYREACDKLGEIAKLANIPSSEAVDLVFEMFTENPFGIYDGIIRSFKDVLNNSGLELLKSKLMLQLSGKQIESEAIKKKERIDSEEMLYGETKDVIRLEDCIKETTNYIFGNISRGLCEIADCRNDVDEYILACAFPKTLYNYDDFHDSDKEEIAERLISQSRATEALEWLSKISNLNAFWNSTPIKLKIAALELLNRIEEAQQERISWFNATLNFNVFEEIMNHADPEFKKEFRKIAIKKAFNSERTSTSLDFFVQAKFIDECSELVQSKIDLLSVNSHYAFRPATKVLRDQYPLSAVLLYRKLIEYVMEGAKSKYYSYAAKDMISCKMLDKEITDYKIFKTHESYFSEFQEKHKRKPAFWARYKEETAKQLKKQKIAIT